MLATKWQKKASKYKAKYLALKKQLGGFDFDSKLESKFMTSKIDPSIKPFKDFYLSQNLFNYWISSSHNTYLPYNQNTDKTSVCYYRLQYLAYAGGCVEIDTYGIENNDVIISHMFSNYSNIKLGDILDIIIDALVSKLERKIISGPFILNFDNSSPNNSLKTKTQQDIFWNTINEKLLSGLNLQKYQNALQKYKNDLQLDNIPVQFIDDNIPVQFINNNFDLSNIKINDMSHKILFRWGLNKNCNSEEVGHDLCPNESITGKFSTNKQWIHLDKGKMGFLKGYVPLRNMSQSISSDFIVSPFEKNLINIHSIVNTQRNLLRFYPHALNISSGNYDNMKYFRNGVQITALNLQTIDNSRLLNDAVFIPATSKFCSPYDIEQGKCNYGLDKVHPLSYRLKPLWLIGLVPYPSLYNLEITLKDTISDLSKFTFIYGLNNKEYKFLNNKITINDVDVTIPFFVVKILGFKNGIEIVWNKSKLSGELTFNVYEFNQEGNYNKVDAQNKLEDCKNFKLLNYKNTKSFTINYNWKLSTSNENKKHLELITPYNESIKEIRTNFRYSTEELLTDLGLLNEYQNTLFDKMKNTN